MKKLISLLASLLLVATVSVPAAAAGDRYNPNDTKFPSDNVLVQVAEEDVINTISWMHTALPNDPSIDPKERDAAQKVCTSLKDPNCDISKDPRLGIAAQSIMASCSEAKANICVENFEVAGKDSEFQPAKFIKAGNPDNRLEPDVSSGLIEGSGPLLFEAGSQKFGVIFKLNQGFNRSTGKFNIWNFSGIVLPVRLAPSVQGVSCVFELDGQCAIAQDFDEGTKLRLKFNLPSSIGGWFRGRLKDPIIQVAAAGANANKITIEAEPVTVARLAVPRNPNLMQGSELEWYRTFARWGVPSGVSAGIDASTPRAFEYIDFYRDVVKDISTGVQTSWILNTVQSGGGSQCLADTSKVLGIVTTNSMVYSGTSPAFENGYLNYKVAGMHFMPDGKTEVLGTYDLVMRSETARCLYGFSKAPVSATVSVSGGSESVATTVVSEKDGWLKMAAYGFTFSQKTIQIKMTQKTVAKKSTITCVKGKVTKKVTASAPKCPTGYKRK